MDPVTTAIIAALSTAASGATTEVAKQAISDSYEGLKGLLKNKFGGESDVAEAVDRLEDKPDANGRRQTVADEMRAVNAGADSDLLAAAQTLLDLIKGSPGGERHIQHVQGNFNAVADRGSTASINVFGSAGKRE